MGTWEMRKLKSKWCRRDVVWWNSKNSSYPMWCLAIAPAEIVPRPTYIQCWCTCDYGYDLHVDETLNNSPRIPKYSFEWQIENAVSLRYQLWLLEEHACWLKDCYLRPHRTITTEDHKKRICKTGHNRNNCSPGFWTCPQFTRNHDRRKKSIIKKRAKDNDDWKQRIKAYLGNLHSSHSASVSFSEKRFPPAGTFDLARIFSRQI
jgi:hypothetical protein